MKKLLLSASFNLCPRKEEYYPDYVRSGLKFYEEHGFEGAEFNSQALELSNEGWKSQMEDILRITEGSSVKLATAHLPFHGGVDDSEDFLRNFDVRMHNAIDAMALLGVEYAVLHPNVGTVVARKYNFREQLDKSISNMSPYVEHAEKVGLKLIVENMRIGQGIRYLHRFCQTPEELCELADALGIGICWDFGHANISGLVQSEALAYVGKRLKAIHVNDNTAVDDDHVPPYSGSVDWVDAMHGLALADYKGSFNFELTARCPEEARGAYADYIAALGRTLMGYIK